MVGSPHLTKECHSYSPSLGTCSFQKLGADLEELLGGSHGDFTITVQGRAYPLHRCILAARCSFFRKYFDNLQNEESKAELDLGKVSNLEKVGQEAFVAVIKYVYGGRVRLLGSAVACWDETCCHEACHPVIKYVQDFLRTAAVFDLPELKVHAEQHLVSLVEKVPGEYLTGMVKVAETHEAKNLYARCLDVLAKKTNWNYGSLEKAVGKELAKEVKDQRRNLGLLLPTEEETLRERHAWRVQLALDSDDVELVLMLLKEGQFSFDDVYGLHYAAGHCDEKIVRELLDLELSNPNVKDHIGHTVLHIACMRREPEILAGLLAKGARSSDVTPDGRTGSQIVRRLTKKGGEGSGVAAEEEAHKARLCLEILEQAEININATYSKSFREVLSMTNTTERELVQKLLYLENRVGLAKVLFPREAQIVMSLAHLETTSEFTGVDKFGEADKVQASTSPVSFSKGQSPKRSPITSNNTKAEGSEGGVDATLLQRVGALQKTVELGHRFFPRCSAILNKYMDDDMGDITTLDKIPPEEQSSKKQRLDELKEILAEAFTKDVADMDQQKEAEAEVQFRVLGLTKVGEKLSTKWREVQQMVYLRMDLSTISGLHFESLFAVTRKFMNLTRSTSSYPFSFLFSTCLFNKLQKTEIYSGILLINSGTLTETKHAGRYTVKHLPQTLTMGADEANWGHVCGQRSAPCDLDSGIYKTACGSYLGPYCSVLLQKSSFHMYVQELMRNQVHLEYSYCIPLGKEKSAYLVILVLCMYPFVLLVDS